MDCGDGTLGQIYRLYGDKTNDVLSRIKAIYVSHLHIDHFGGDFLPFCIFWLNLNN